MFPYRRMPTHIIGLYVFTVVNFLALFHITVVQAEVLVKLTAYNQTLASYSDLPALFGRPIPWNGLAGFLVNSNPQNACTHVVGPPDIHGTNIKWILLVQRGVCHFDAKVRNAQKANYHAVIVYNDEGTDKLEQMSAGSEEPDLIPSVFVGRRDGTEMQRRYTYDKINYTIIIDNDSDSGNILKYLIAFACIMGIIFLTTVAAVIFRHVQNLRQQRRHQLSPQNLKKLPVKKFEKGSMQYETCAICLEDYMEGDKLRILPCAHAYHTKCIDPWLTKSRRSCPVCKRKVFTNGEVSDSDDDSEDDERTPLLQPNDNTPTTSGNTFTAPSSFFSFMPQFSRPPDPPETPEPDIGTAAAGSNDETVESRNEPLFRPASSSLGGSINVNNDDVVVMISGTHQQRTTGYSPIQIGVEATAAPQSIRGTETHPVEKENVLVI